MIWPVESRVSKSKSECMGILGITLWSSKSVRSRGVCGVTWCLSSCASSEIACSSGGSLPFRIWQEERFHRNAYVD